MSELAQRIAQNLAAVRQRMADAAARSARTPDHVRLVAVTKSASHAGIRALVEAGCRELGESRPQQLWEKAEQLRDLPIRWHLIGHLQRNKVRRTLGLVEMIHSADSVRLIEAIDRIAGEAPVPISSPARRVPLLLEVNVSGDSAKHGFDPEGIEAVLDALAGLRRVEIRGLMCMAGLEGDLDAARRDFARLRQLRDRLRPRCPEEVLLDELSMGMSSDYEVAIEEGATIVRIGSALFEGTGP
jgi:pyridoxal phosphate enzyme (YggS family)